ncbi:hypothetical protein GGG16DRAFT_99063 [Schizophyllum commune]
MQQPSQYDIQREVEALRDLKRRSSTPATIDPDLPAAAAGGGSGSLHWSGGGASSGGTSSGSAHSHEDGTTDDHSEESSSTSHSGSSEGAASAADDPLHLFWVPASLHPEIAPQEFRAFLKEHSRNPPTDASATLSRSPSMSSVSSGLGRQKSMLSRQYRPREGDDVENEEVVPLRRNRSSYYQSQGPQLTISDLQKLEELAEESNDPGQLRTMLRRSLSLNLSPTALTSMDKVPDMPDEADAPIIVPPPGLILRRAARTKIRKPGLPGDGNGHRFGSTRKGGRTRRSSDVSSDHGSAESEEVVGPSTIRRKRTLSEEQPQPRPDSISDTIYDAYVREDEENPPVPPVPIITSPPPEEPQPEPEAPQAVPEPVAPVAEPETEPAVRPDLLEALGPVLHQPQPQQPYLAPEPPEAATPSRTPSPAETTTSPPPTQPAGAEPGPSQPIFPTPAGHRKEKDKKGLFGKWGSDKNAKKHHKSSESLARDRAAEKEKEKEKEKDSGFFGSLFGGKKKQDDNVPSPLSSASGREAAQALLGASKSSKTYQPPPSPSQPSTPGMNNWSRYPIHVERAIYRLSHIKLANPRRPLYEQVLISNLMFWYLGVINKAQNPTAQVAGAGAGANGANGQANGAQQPSEEEQARQRAEQEAKEKAEREKAEQEQREREEQKKREQQQPRRGPLTKPAPAGQAGGRRAEMPIKGPQYDVQHREMEQQQYGGGYNGSIQPGMVMPRQHPPQQQRGPPPNQYGNGPQYGNGQAPGQYANGPPNQYGNGIPGQYGAPKLVQPQPQQQPDNYYYQADPMRSGGLPPGAMPPMQRPPGSPSPPPGSQNPHRSSRSPPPMVQNNGSKPGRSLSATAVPSPPPQGGNVLAKPRKGQSAHAVPAGHRSRTVSGGGSGRPNGVQEEDVPLAMWQQQQQQQRRR